jgi:formamidopyrimidine-DNA glycosylase
MPELPEVETYVRDLAGVLPGRKIVSVWVDWINQVPTLDQLVERAPGQAVEEVGRRGKYIVCRLSRDWLIIHLKMSGRLEIVPTSAGPDRHVHVCLRLDRDDELRLRDPRKFGRVYLVDECDRVLGGLGPEPLGGGLTAPDFAAMLTQRRGALKPLLLNQAFMAGLGNIYVDEALWQARLHPLRTAKSLSAGEARRLWRSIRRVLQRGIAARGATLRDGRYRDLAGRAGGMQEELRVYGRAGLPCARCGQRLQRLVVGQRGTVCCRVCQPQP